MAKKNKTDLEHDVEQDSEQSETNTEHHVEQPCEQDNGTVDSALLDKAVSLRRQGKTYRKLEEITGIPKATLHRHLQGIVPKTQDSKNTMLESDLPEENTSFPNEPVDFLSDTELRMEEGNLKRKNNVLRLRAKNALLTYAASNPGAYIQSQNWNGGHGNPRQDSEITKLREEIRDLKQSIQNQGTGKLVLESIATGFNMAPKSSGRDPMEYLMAGNNLRESVEKNVQSQYSHGVEKNMIDLKLAEMGQLERIENKKIDLTEKRHDEAIEERNQIYGIVKEAIKGPVETLTRSLGSAAADKIRGIPKAPQIVDVTCPACSRVFKADGDARVLICGFCGAQLQKQGSPPPQQPQPIPETPQPQQPSEPQNIEQPSQPQETPREKLSEKPQQSEVI
jgi:hypothetical protein